MKHLFRFMSEIEFDDVIRFVEQEKHLKMPAFEKEGEPYREVHFWSAGEDDDVEGEFVNYYSKEPMPYLPWGKNRPYAAGTTYNRLKTRVKVPFENNTELKETEARVLDYGGYWDDMTLIAVCTVPSRNLKFFLRGLCPDIGYNREFVHTIDEEGNQVYMGRYNTLLQFNKTSNLWNLYKPTDNSSIITSSSPFDTFLIGKHQVSFDLAEDNKCFKGQSLQYIKLTTCITGQFTCNSGHCISMSMRCDQTPHCPDESDEQDCKIIIMKKNYNQNQK